MKARWFTLLGGISGCMLVMATVGVGVTAGANGDPSIGARENRGFNSHAQAIAVLRDILEESGGEGPRQTASGPEQEQYENRAYPRTYITYDRVNKAKDAELEREQHGGGKFSGWQEIGPFTPNVPAEATFTGHPTTNSGRVTALLLSPRCRPNNCKLWVGAAGGGVWFTPDALAQNPVWKSVSNGLGSNAIGSLAIALNPDRDDDEEYILYAGTGEPNGSGDSEAGVGLYRLKNGRDWELVPGSVRVAKDRSIAAIAVDPLNPRRIFIGTAVARHGSSSVNGGRFTPPGAPTVGMYRSLDGGGTFSLVFNVASDVVSPGSPTGGDFFRGGISKIELDRTGLTPEQPSRVYFSVFDYGFYRSTGKGSFEQVFASAGGGTIANSVSSRTEFALVPMGGNLRIYVGDSGSGPADFYRVDNANVPAAMLTNGTTNPGWIKLSDSTKGTPGFASYNYCGGQCVYDMVIASPPGHPDVVWIGGQMQYDEIFSANPPSNGRTVQRSTDAGVHFTDMTADTQSPSLGMHPDQHAIAFDPQNPDIAFLGSDGGVVRTSGSFADASIQCASRGLSDADLTDCQMWLSAIPTQTLSLNDGLRTLQFQSLSLNAHDPKNDVLGGTQDNGTWAYDGTSGGSWFESVGGDGGQSGTDVANTNVRMHTYFGQQGDVNFTGTDPLGWDWMADPLLGSLESASFYVPLINDPKTGSSWFVGLQHVWRTQDNAGTQDHLDSQCNEFLPAGQFDPNNDCGDWEPLGGPAGADQPGDLVSSLYGTTKGGSYVVALGRTASNAGTLWVGTRRGRLFISQNADAAAAKVTFTRIDTNAQPTRFISSIAVDPNNPNHAVVSFSGYNAYTPATPGHVFDVMFNPGTGKTTWKNLSYDLGDQPITGIAFDDKTGDLFASTDFGVALLPADKTSWVPAAPGLPRVAVYGLTINSSARLLYAATHGRGAWRLDLGRVKREN